MTKTWKKTLVYLFLGVMLVAIYFPMVMIIIYSFTPAKALGKWDGFNPLYYAKIFQNSDIMGAVGNSLLIALISATLAMIIGTISAIGVYNLSRKMKGSANAINQVTIVNSEIVTAVAFMLFFLIIRNFISNSLDVADVHDGFGGFLLSIAQNGYVRLVIAHTMITVPFVILAVTPRLTQLNPNLFEAGLDLGASPKRALLTVLIPQLVPSMVSGFVMAFTLSLDDFVVANMVKGEVKTISVLIYNQYKKHGADPVYRVFVSLIVLTVFTVLIIVNLVKKYKNVANKKTSATKNKER